MTKNPYGSLEIIKSDPSSSVAAIGQDARIVRRSDQFDSRTVSGHRSEASVACDERRVQYFCERDVHRIVGAEIVPQFPHPRQKQRVRVSAQWKIAEINERCAAALSMDLTSRGIPTDDLCYLDIEEVWRVQCLA